MSNKTVYFFVGTDAEFIKIFPVILACRKNNMNTAIIASGQNDIKQSRIFELYDDIKIDIELSSEKQIKKSARGLLEWYLRTNMKAAALIKKRFGYENLVNAPMIVHGDTISTMMGAFIGKHLGMLVCHVEAGLRSHNILNPFPEEIDRLITSKMARVHFAPGETPVMNLRKVKGKVVNTRINTLADSLNISKEVPVKNDKVAAIIDSDYFVFVMHRQENLMNKALLKECIENVIKLTEKHKCVIILHKPTEVALNEQNLLSGLRQNKNVILLPRIDYFDFMKLLASSVFVITDGGSNQEELSYMGKPTLILRNNTERNEGLNENVILYGGDVGKILRMDTEYKELQKNEKKFSDSPSEIIAKCLYQL